MAVYLYLSLYPESLIASMLVPEKFGTYLAISTKKRQSRQEAIYFEVDIAMCSEVFDLSQIDKECVSHENGEPKHSVYYSIYRVLERVPLAAIKDIYLATKHGKVLQLQKSTAIPEFNKTCYLYQEIAPVHPRIISTLNPVQFAEFITDSKAKISVPKICFVDLRLGELADNPEGGHIYDLPYPHIEYLRECLIQVKNNPKKHTKTVNRIQSQSFLYRTINYGFFVGSNDEILYYPFPSEKELERDYFSWWHSATE